LALDINRCCPWIGGEVEWDSGEERIQFAGYHHTFPSVLDTLWAR
jgi:hypothetical protein